jgi:thiol-disulfide isomerase/thioredoxin
MTLATFALALLAWGTPSNSQPILLDFHAAWCGPCREMRPVVAQLDDRGIPVRSIDIDESKDLAKRFQIDRVPTFVVIDPKGNELGRVHGVQRASALENLYDQAREKLAGDTAQVDKPATTAQNQSAASPWETTVRIRVHSGRLIGFGSGTVIHSTTDEAIILTCAHIFSIEGRKQAAPDRFPHRVTVDLFDGTLHGDDDKKAKWLRPTDTNIEAQVIDYDFKADVGLIKIKPGRRIPASRVVPPGWTPSVGDFMTTAGCSEGRDATIWTTKITTPQIRGLVGRQDYEAIECEFAPKQGRSGGGLYTFETGLVAGVCNFQEPTGNKGLYATPKSIHRILDRNNLQICYAPRRDNPNAPDTLLASRRRDEQNPDVVYRSQDPGRKPLFMPEPDVFGVASRDSESASAGLSRGDRWESRANPAAPRSAALGGNSLPNNPSTTDLNVAADAINDPFASLPPANAKSPTADSQKPTSPAPTASTAKAWKSSTR